MGADERVNIGMIAICPSTGDVVWDQFEGKCFIRFGSTASSSVTLRRLYAYGARGRYCFGLPTSRPSCIFPKPAELLLAEQGLTKPSERMLKYFAGYALRSPSSCKRSCLRPYNRSATTERRIRIERYKNQLSYTDAFDFVSQFYTQKTQSGKASTSFTSGLYLTSHCAWRANIRQGS